MTRDEETILLIKGAISELPPDLREATEELAEHFRMNIKTAGPIVGRMALALVGAEHSVQD